MYNEQSDNLKGSNDCCHNKCQECKEFLLYAKQKLDEINRILDLAYEFNQDAQDALYKGLECYEECSQSPCCELPCCELPSCDDSCCELPCCNNHCCEHHCSDEFQIDEFDFKIPNFDELPIDRLHEGINTFDDSHVFHDTKVVEDAVEEIIEDIIEDVVEDTIEDVVEDIVEDTIEDVIEDTIEDVIEDTIEDVIEDTIEDVIDDIVEDTIEENIEESTFKHTSFNNYDIGNEPIFKQVTFEEFKLNAEPVEDKSLEISAKDTISEEPVNNDLQTHYQNQFKHIYNNKNTNKQPDTLGNRDNLSPQELLKKHNNNLKMNNKKQFTQQFDMKKQMPTKKEQPQVNNSDIQLEKPCKVCKKDPCICNKQFFSKMFKMK